MAVAAAKTGSLTVMTANLDSASEATDGRADDGRQRLILARTRAAL